VTGAVTTYTVGPGQQYASLRALLADPNHPLMPGDTVNVYYDPNTYLGGITFTRSGSGDAKITIHGVIDSNGRRPVIKALINTTTEPDLVHMYADHYLFENIEIDGSANQGNSWN